MKQVVHLFFISVIYLMGIMEMECFNLNAFLLNDLEDHVHIMVNLGADWEKDNLAIKGILTPIVMKLHANYRSTTIDNFWGDFWKA